MILAKRRCAVIHYTLAVSVGHRCIDASPQKASISSRSHTRSWVRCHVDEIFNLSSPSSAGLFSPELGCRSGIAAEVVIGRTKSHHGFNRRRSPYIRQSTSLRRHHSTLKRFITRQRNIGRRQTDQWLSANRHTKLTQALAIPS